MTWQAFIYFAIAAALLWIAGAVLALRRTAHGAATSNRQATSGCQETSNRQDHPAAYSRWAIVLTGAGLLVYTVFIAGLWVGLQRPPLRTMGETRLWYAFFLILAGLLTYRRWHYGWLLLCSTVIALVFVLINLLKPEIHDQSLMPALQSFWFIPHVTVYIFSYAVLGCAFLLALAGWGQKTDGYFPTIDRLVYIGTAFLTLGMLSGMLWAKAAWGTFWGWDPKETWAAVTWCVYLLYIHLRLYGRGNRAVLNWLLTVGFLCMQMCWYGVNYLPAAKASLHVYG